MPSRRRVLETTGSALGVGSLAGCLSALRPSKTGHLQLKAVTLRWNHDGRTYQDEPLDLQYDRGDRTITGQYDPDFVGNAVRSPDEVVVTDDLQERLDWRFDVEYVVGVCGSDFGDGEYGCRNTQTGREAFNRVQLDDHAEVRLSDGRFEVVDVTEDASTVESVNVRTFDFAERHADHGIRPDEW